MMDGDDFVAVYSSSHFDMGFDDEEIFPFAVVIKVDDMTDYDDHPHENYVQVKIAPMRITEKAQQDLLKSGCIDESQLDSPTAIAYAADSYGMSASVTDFARRIGVPDAVMSFEQAIETDDYDVLMDWIRQYGDKLADGFGIMIGMALDRPQNQIGENGWDWLGPHMKEDYSSATMWPRPAARESEHDGADQGHNL